MFDQIKKLKQLRDIQNAVKKEKAVAEKMGVKVVINGVFEVEEVKLNPGLDIFEQEKILKECLNEARESVQKIVAKNLMDSGLGGGL